MTFVTVDNDKICSVTSQNLDWIDNYDKTAVNFLQLFVQVLSTFWLINNQVS